jgi:hypothetical protein
MKDVGTALHQIEVLSQTLNQSSDLLSQKIVEIESAINQYKLGVWAWLEQPLFHQMESDGNGHDMEMTYHLGYGKVRDKWGILMHQRLDYDPESFEPIFLKDAPRDIRVRAIDHISELIERIAAKAAEVNQQVAQKTKLAEQIAASLKRAK